jgi:hypothetical protein
MEDKEQNIQDAINDAEKNNVYDAVEHQTGMLDLEDEIVEEEDEIVQDLPETNLLDLPSPEIVEENVKLKTDGRNFSELSSFEKVKFAASQNGVAVEEPKSSCKYCHGTGIVSTKKIKTETPISSGDTSGTEIIEELPNPCRCIFKKEDLPKMFTGKILMSRKLERSQNKDFQKKNLKKSSTFKLEKIRLAKKKRNKKKAKKKMKKKFNKR